MSLRNLFFILFLLTSNASASTTIVDLYTSYGRIGLELFPEQAPATVSNFLHYVDSGAYNGTLFHRVVKNFVVQGGGFDQQFNPINGIGPIVNESSNGLSNARGTIAMARTSSPHSATSQFFFNVVNNASLDYGATSTVWGYAVFGKVIEGMELIDLINQVPTGSLANGYQNVPLTNVLVGAARRRQAQLSFPGLKSLYQPGETLSIQVDEVGLQRTRALDLWVAIQRPDGSYLFFNEAGDLGSTAQPVRRQVATTVRQHPIFSFQVPGGLTGQYGVYAIFNEPNAGLDQLWSTLQSNIASSLVELK